MIIVDVLSFTTCVDVAVAHDALVFPYRCNDVSTVAFAQSVNAVPAGRRGDVPSLSPHALQSLPARSRIVLPSPNGSTCTVLAQEHHIAILASCLRNAAAVFQFILRQYAEASIAVIACGEQWPNDTMRPAIEDLIGSGALLSLFDPVWLSPEAQIAVGAYQRARTDLSSFLRNSASGRELTSKGFLKDVEMAAQLHVSQAVPMFIDGAYRQALVKRS